MSARPTINYVTILKLLGVVFVGLHIPLAAVAFARFSLAATQPSELIVAAFVGTILAALGTLGMMWRMLSQVRQHVVAA